MWLSVHVQLKEFEVRARVKMEEGIFIRKFEIDSCGKSLTLCQKEVGDVSCVVWDAALVLAKYLEARCNDMQDWLRGRSVVELGAGMGCVGLTAACFGAYVTMTDLSEVMPFLQKNIDINETVWNSLGGKVYTQVLQWGLDLQDWKTADVLLLADCVYYMESVEPLVKTLCHLADFSTEVFISQEERDTEKQQTVWRAFQELLQRHFEVTKIPEQELHPEFHSSDIIVLRAVKRHLVN